MGESRVRAPYVPREGSRVWGYAVPLLLVIPWVVLCLPLLWSVPLPAAIVGGAVTGTTILVVALLAARTR